MIVSDSTFNIILTPPEGMTAISLLAGALQACKNSGLSLTINSALSDNDGEGHYTVKLWNHGPDLAEEDFLKTCADATGVQEAVRIQNWLITDWYDFTGILDDYTGNLETTITETSTEAPGLLSGVYKKALVLVVAVGALLAVWELIKLTPRRNARVAA